MFKNVLVVVDSRAAVGKPLGALADYVAMMALSQAKALDGCSAFASILDLMAKSPCPGRDPPDGLTSADATFLTALYDSNHEATALSEQAEIANRMAENLIKANTLEERIYRMRCVEGWSMVIPWVGFPLKDLLAQVKPTSKAKFVAFETLMRPSEMPG